MVEFTPVKIKIFKSQKIIQRLLHGIAPEKFGQFESDPQTIIFLCKRTAKLIMQRLHKQFPLQKKEKEFDFIISESIRIQCRLIPKVKHSELTRIKRTQFPEYIYVSLDGINGYRCKPRGNRVYFDGRLVLLSGKKFINTHFYSLEA